MSMELDAAREITGRWLILGEPGAGKSTLAR
jgi:ABC-type molybdenum transport system ATPase subunit/photorepair protein PhrA